MDTLLARGEVRIVVNTKAEDGASFIVTPPSEGFCINQGITIDSKNKEGSSLKWEYNGQPVYFPYYPPDASTYTKSTYTLKALIYNACYPSSSPKKHDVTVQVAPIPTVKVMPDTTVCHGASVALKAQSGSFVGDTLMWTLTGANEGKKTKDTVVIYTTTTFRAIAVSKACPDVSDEVTVFRMPDAKVEVKPTMEACEGEEIQLHVEKTVEVDTVIWRSSHFDFIGEGDDILVRVAGSETYTAVASNRCSKDSASLSLTAWDLPFIAVKPDTSICYGVSLNLDSCIIHSVAGSLQWTPGYSASLTEPAVYIATTTSQHNCGSASDTLFVDVYPPLILLPDHSDLPRYNKQDFYDVSFQTLQATPVLTYSINGALPPGLTLTNGRISGQPALGPYDYNTHHLQVSVVDEHRCRASREYTLAPEWKAANMLLPMGDPGNAIFLPEYQLEVYNRNGLLLHKGTGWNGTWNNAFVPSGTYFYKVNILIDNIPEERMSYVVVMYY
jgi:hypothetical protein